MSDERVVTGEWRLRCGGREGLLVAALKIAADMCRMGGGTVGREGFL
jgi:hypothetical protein